MHHPPRSSTEIETIPPAPGSNNNRLIYWDTATGPQDPQYETKYPAGLWSVGGSTTVSLAGNPTLDGDEPTTRQSSFSGYMTCSLDPRMQTGNTVFIALGVSGQPAYPAYLWAKSLIALTVFVIGNVIFIRVGRALGARRRSTLILSFGVQTACILAAALLVQLGVVAPKPEDPRAPIEWMQVLPISLLAFQASGQIVASRVLEYDELPTVVLTTLLCDLLVDPNLGAAVKANPKRNRRIGGFLALFLGAMTAGGLSKVTEMAASLWFAMGIKLIITVSWFVWKGERNEKIEGIGSV
ncbi:hypothetical protein BJX63DRAFT_63404 [Aspergillus granulosus]|uniref:DUF1275 domain protein n=1 Tax=Aspergillus granulosus TaxID=176169 RepID=A0ABR4GWU4_9EURO